MTASSRQAPELADRCEPARMRLLCNITADLDPAGCGTDGFPAKVGQETQCVSISTPRTTFELTVRQVTSLGSPSFAKLVPSPPVPRAGHTTP